MRDRLRKEVAERKPDTNMRKKKWVGILQVDEWVDISVLCCVTIHEA